MYSVWMSTLWVMELSRQLCGKMRRSGRKAYLSSPPASTFGLEIHFYTPNVHQLEYLSGCYTAEELCVKAAKKCCKWQACLLLKYLCARFYDTFKSNNPVDHQPQLLITKSQSNIVLCNTWIKTIKSFLVWTGLWCGIVNNTPKILVLFDWVAILKMERDPKGKLMYTQWTREKQKLRLQRAQRQCGINFVQSYWLSAAIWAVNMSDKMH